jgi:tetratricopeptide (TPR) repeat protein
MAKALRISPRRKMEKRNPSRRLLLVTALLGGVLVTTGVGFYVGRRAANTQPAPTVDLELPSVDWTGVDPAVRKAIDMGRTGVRQSPHSAPAWGRLGMILAAHNFATEANACFAQAEQLDPREARWPYYLGTELCANDPEVAIAKLQRAVELKDGRFNRARLRLGELLFRQGRLDEAEEQFRQVLRQNPESAQAHLNLARIAREQGNLQTSLKHLGRSMEGVYTRKASHLLAAEIQRRLGDQSAAALERRQAAKLPKDPDWPDPMFEEIMPLRVGKQARLGAAAQLISQGHYREAAALLQGIVHDYPDSDWAWLLLGRAFLGQNDLPAAVAPLRTAAKLAPASMEAHFYLGVVLLLQGKPQDAAACFRQATAIKPDFAEAHHNLAHCLLRQGDRTGAIEAFRAALNCKPNYVEAHLDLAEALAQEGKNADAVVHVRYAAQLNPSNPKAKKLLEQLGR